MALTPAEAQFYLDKDPSLLIFEYLPGREYTVDCFTTHRGELLFSSARERRRILNGISVNTTGADDSRFVEFATTINQALELRGVWFFQIKEDKDGELALLEVAPRVAGAMALTRCRGVNLVLLSLFDAIGIDVSVTLNDYELTLDRALENRYRHNLEYEHVYLDFDDVVVCNGRVNVQVVAFIYQCLNKNIRIHLLTKHRDDIHQTLKRFRLDAIADELVWIQGAGDHKYRHVRESSAIFVDDSFAERQAVQQHCGIPTFDAHMIECLLEEN